MGITLNKTKNKCLTNGGVGLHTKLSAGVAQHFSRSHVYSAVGAEQARNELFVSSAFAYGFDVFQHITVIFG